jgi:hypothetical protein
MGVLKKGDETREHNNAAELTLTRLSKRSIFYWILLATFWKGDHTWHHEKQECNIEMDEVG